MMSQGLEKNIQKIISSMQPGKLAYESKRAERAGMTLVEWIKEKEYKKLSIVAYEDIVVKKPKQAVLQRICAIRKST